MKFLDKGILDVLVPVENNTELIIGKFNPILNELLSKPIEVEYKQSEYQKLTKEYLTKKVADIINNDKNYKYIIIRRNMLWKF